MKILARRLGLCSLVATLAITFLATANTASAQGSICAEGGGSLAADEWAAPAFEWMARAARRNGAAVERNQLRVVILGNLDEGQAAPTQQQLDEMGDETAARFKALGVASVRQLYINTANASDTDIADAIRAADIVWCRGGSQSRYCANWNGTPVEDAIRAVFDRGGVIGGTSAGCAILGEFIYDARGGSCDTSTALRDPFAEEISFTTDFLNLTPNVLFDTHFTERARIGRLAVYLARLRAEHRRLVLGVGVDARTALCIGPDGEAEVFGTGAVCLMHLTPDSRHTIEPAKGTWPTPPAVTDIEVRQLVAGQKLNIRDLSTALTKLSADLPDRATPAPTYIKEADRTDTLFVRGDATQHAQRGLHFIPADAAKDALWKGTLSLGDGTNELPDAILATRTLSLRERTQNAAGGVLWGLTTTDARWATFLDAGAALRMTDDGSLESYFPHGKLGAAMASPVFVKTERFAKGPKPPGPRQSCAFDGVRMHVLPPLWRFDPSTSHASPPTQSLRAR